MGRFWRPKWGQKIFLARFVWIFLGVHKCSLFLSCFGSPPRRPKRVQEAPKRPQEASRSAPRGPKRHPRAPQEAPRGPQETPRAGQEGSRLSKIAPRGSQKASKTHKIAEVDVSQRPCPKSHNEKRRAGGGDPPWGSQSAARTEGKGPRRVRLTYAIAETRAQVRRILPQIFSRGVF